MSPFARPTFDPKGRLVARRELTVGERAYQPGDELPAAARAEIAPRLATLWQLGMIDTLPAEVATMPTDAELERLTAPPPRPAPGPAKPARR